MVPDSLSRLVVAPSAIYALLIAAVITFALTPLAMRAAWRFGVVDRPGGRRIHDRPIPLLGGIAIFLGILVAVLPNLDVDRRYASILIGAGLICLLGVIDDRFGIPPLPKLLGQIACAAIPVATGMTIDSVTIPFIEPSTVSFGVLAYPLTMIFIVAVANVVNLADGMDGLAAGVCGISALTFAILALSLGRISAGVMAAAVAGACFGFLPWNFNPAKVFMGDTGSLAIGGAFGTVAILLKAEFLLVIIGGVFVAEAVSVMLQTGVYKWYKRTRGREYADAHRVFRMAPLHHHFEKLGWAETTVVVRFWIVGICCALVALATLKLR